MERSAIVFAGAAQQTRLLASGAMTAPELVELFLERIERWDPLLNAYRVVCADRARAEASDAQQRLDAGERGRCWAYRSR